MKQISTYSKMNAHLLTHTHISRMALYAAFLFIGVMCSVGNAWGTTYTYRLVVDKSALVDGKRYILLVNNRTAAYNCTTSSSHFQTGGTFSSSSASAGSVVTTETAASSIKYVTLIRVSGDTYKILDSDGKYMTATAAKSGSGSRADTDDSGWNFTGTSGMVPIYQASGKNAHLRSYSNSSFRTYADDKNGDVIYLATGCSVTYNANGATSGTVPSDTYLYGEGGTVTAKTNSGTLAKTGGYTFSGWNTKADGTGTDIATSGTFTITKDTVLYAKWSGGASCDGDADMSSSAASLKGSFTLSSVGVTVTGMDKGDNCSWSEAGFVWSPSSNTTPTVGGTNCDTETPILTSGNATTCDGTLTGTFSTGDTYYYRAYGKNNYGSATYQYSAVQSFTPRSVTFDLQGHGSSTPTTQYVNNGGKATDPSYSESVTGYRFVGWYKEEACTNAWDFSTDVVSGDNKTLYAKWVPDPTITFSVPTGVTKPDSQRSSVNLPTPSDFPTAISSYSDHWAFAGWTESSSVNSSSKPTLYPAGAPYTGATTTAFTLYAVYSRNKYLVVYDNDMLVADDDYIITTWEEDNYAVAGTANGDDAYVADMDDHFHDKQLSGLHYYTLNNPHDSVVWHLTGSAGAWVLKNKATNKYLDLPTSGAMISDDEAELTITESDQIYSISKSSKYLSISSSGATTANSAAYYFLYKKLSTLYMTTPAEPTYSVTWKISGQSDSISTGIPACVGLTAAKMHSTPADNLIGACANKFMGWSATELGSADDQDAPDDLFTTYDKAPYMTGDLTLYAVYATTSTYFGTANLTSSEINARYCNGSGSCGSQTQYSNSPFTIDSDDGDWTGVFAISNSTSGLSINSTSYGSPTSVRAHLESPTYNDNVTSIRISATHNANDSKTIYICSGSTTTPASSNIGSVTVPKGSDVYVIEPSSEVTSFYIYASASVNITAISVDYGTVSDYRTACVVQYDIVLDDGEVAATNNGSAKVAADAKELTDITAPTKTGYKVVKYTTGNGSGSDIADKDGKLNASVSVSATVWTNSSKEWKKGSGATFYASWTPISYSVRFNANDEGKTGTASGSMSNQDFDYGTAQNLTTNAFSLTGYTFQGWATSAGGSVAHTDGRSVSNLSTTDGDVVDLYAVWQANTYDVTLAATDETSSVGSQVVTATYGSSMPTTLKGSGDVDAPERTGYTFDGWEYSSTQYYSYNSGTSTISSAHIWDIANSTTTLTPRWNVNSYTLAWDKNGGNALTGDYTSGSVNYGATITAPNTPTRSGYDFAGWNDGSGVVTPATTMPAGDVTYTATWTKKTASGWTWTYNSAAIPDPFVIYVGINKTLVITWDPSDLLSEKKGYTVTKTDSYVAQGAKANDYYTMRGAAGVTEVTNTTVTFSLSGLSDVEINVTVKPQPRVHFVDNIHGESFDDLLPTVVSYVATFTKSTPTHSDVSDPGSDYNSCERQHIHLVGWIRSDWANEHPGASHLQITSAGNDDAGNPYYYTAGADIDVEAQDGQTFYAVWSKIE